jgi:hypothetical protein
VAAVLPQLPFSSGVEQQVIAAAKGCLQLAGSGSSSATVAADALAAVSKQLHAAGGAESFIPCLHQGLQLAVGVVGSSQQEEQLNAATNFLAEAAAAAAKWQHGRAGVSDASTSQLPPVGDVLAAAVRELALCAQQCSSNGSSSTGARMQAVLGGLLALGGALQPAPAAGSNGTVPAVHVAADVAAPAAADSFEDDDWADDPFGEAADGAAEGAEAGAAAAAAAGGGIPSNLAALSLADAPGSSGASEASPVADAAQQLVLQVLAAAAGSDDSTVQHHTLVALRAFFQQQQATAGASQPAAAEQRPWALQCAAAALPGAMARIHDLMSSSSSTGRLSGTDIQVGEAAGELDLVRSMLHYECVCVLAPCHV